MDGMREGDGRGGAGEAEGGRRACAGAGVGTDERRMHVRAYNYWVSLLKGRAYPSVANLDPAELADFGPHSVLLDFTGGNDDPGVAFLGHRLREECGLTGEIATISDVPGRSLLSRLTDHYLQIIANRAPIGFEAEFTGRRGYHTLYRGILMPFSSDDRTIDFVYGVINWKEMVDAPTQDALTREVGAALATPPAPPASVLPVFADGPSALGTAAALAAAPRMPVAIDDAPMPAPTPEDEDTLADGLEAARACAQAAVAADGRSRDALYAALGLAYDFALATARHPDDYAELLEDCGIRAQARAPMTPVVKLVFGAGYDKTRLTEFAAALSWGVRSGIARGALAGRIAATRGGLKAVVQAERAARRGPAPREHGDPAHSLRTAPAIARIADIGDAAQEFVLLLARRDADGLAVVATVDGQAALVDRALRSVAKTL